MSHSTISANRDYLPGRDVGSLTNPAQSASFTVEPLLTPTITSRLPHPVLPDPTPSENPELFDKSTAHANTHYHPEAKLSKKKRAKKLGLGYVAKPHGTASTHAGGHTFSAHEKEAHERADKRDEAIGTASADDEEDDDDDEEDDEASAQDEEQSRKQHHENRITGTEKGEKHPTNKRDESAGKDKDDKDGEKGEEDGDEQDKEKGENPSLIQRATNVLSSAQQKATGVVSGVTSTVLSTAQSVPGVGALLSKVGLGAAKSDDSEKGEDKESDKKDDKAEDKEKGDDKSKEDGKGGEEEGPGSKVDVNAKPSTEAKPGKGDEKFGNKQSTKQDALLDKSQSKAGQK